MSSCATLITTPEHCIAVVMLAHGAGAGMDSDFMNAISQALDKRAIGVIRFEFAYMAQRREGGSKRPPPKIPLLVSEWAARLEALPQPKPPLFIGGKSMGGRIASVMNSAQAPDQPCDDLQHPIWEGVICLGYPFHPQKKPLTLRTAHLKHTATPTLIVQGTRDALGNEQDVEQYDLCPHITLHWIQTGNHDLKPLIRSNITHEQAIEQAADAIHAFIVRVIGRTAIAR